MLYSKDKKPTWIRGKKVHERIRVRLRCGKKFIFKTEREAEEQAIKSFALREVLLVTYKCKKCGFYHLTSQIWKGNLDEPSSPPSSS